MELNLVFFCECVKRALVEKRKRERKFFVCTYYMDMCYDFNRLGQCNVTGQLLLIYDPASAFITQVR